MMFTRSFWVQVAERALKTAAQSALALLTMDATSLLAVDWRAAGSAAVLAALASVLTSVVGAGVGPAGSPSVVAVAPAAAGDLDGPQAVEGDATGRHALDEDHPYA